MELLAILTQIRQEVSAELKESIYQDLFFNTNLLSFLCRIFEFTEPKDQVRYLHLEATWILTNLAQSSDENCIKELID